MDTQRLRKILTSDTVIGSKFGGVFASDRLPRLIDKRKRLFIANTDPADKPGTHWVAFYFGPNNVCTFFDSYGKPPLLKSFKTFMEKNADCWIYNSQILQHPTSTVCGYYCIVFAHNMCRGSSLSKFLSVFDVDRRFNDLMVVDFVRHHFGNFASRKPVQFNQTCCSILKRSYCT